MQTSLLFAVDEQQPLPRIEAKSELKQYFTPAWAAALLVQKYLPALSDSDLVLEPSCGPGAWLQAIPEDVPVVGVEIDPELAQIARDRTGRPVITGDFATVALPGGVTTIVGNPPYNLDIFESFLSRSHRLLPELATAAFLLPAYFFQTYGRVNQWRERWSMRVDLVPRGLFPGIKCPLTFCVYRKDKRRDMVGFALYAELAAVNNLTERSQEILQNGRPHRSVWRALVEDTLAKLGGRATLEQIYCSIEPHRPTPTAFWKEKVRQQLQQYFLHCGPGEYALPA